MHEILNGLNPDGDARLLAALELPQLLPECGERQEVAPAPGADLVICHISAAADSTRTRRNAGRLLSAAGRAARRE